MKKQKIQLIILLVFLIAIIAGYVGLKKYNDKKAEDTAAAEDTSVTVTDFSADDVTKMNVVYGDSNLTFVLEDGTWYDEADRTLDIDESKISTLISDLNNITSENSLDSPTLSDYGLDAPTQTMTLTTADNEYTFYIGASNDVINEYYFYVNDSSKVYTLSSGTVSAFQITIDDYLAASTDATTTDATTAQN